MAVVDECLSALEQIHEDLMDALVRNDTAQIEALVMAQCRQMSLFPRTEMSDQDSQRLRALQQKVKQQQTLLEQAAKVTQYFLSRLHHESTFTAFG